MPRNVTVGLIQAATPYEAGWSIEKTQKAALEPFRDKTVVVTGANALRDGATVRVVGASDAELEARP